MNLTINVSDELYHRAAEVAATEHVSIAGLFAAVFEERVLEYERLKEKAAKGSYERFRRVMSSRRTTASRRQTSLVESAS
ncbi:MAG TPA: hypothetical protein VN841_04665 [Bryobacteraceae bacterium]|nr:hypothetical protein [Bryobacteraceae bacterium]